MKKATFKEECLSWLTKAASKGAKLITYNCPHCTKDIQTVKPKKSQVGSKGFWDGLKTCYECEKPSFVTVWPDGKIEVVNPFTIKPEQ